MFLACDLDGFQLHGGPVWLDRIPSIFLSSPQPRVVHQALTDRSGSLDLTSLDDGKPCVISGFVRAGDWASLYTLVDQVKGLMAPGTLRKLRCQLASGQWRYAWVGAQDEVAVDDGGSGISPYAVWSTTLFAPNPVVFSEDTINLNYDPNAAAVGNGFSLPLVFPIDFGQSSSALLANNPGTLPADPVYRFTGLWTNPYVVLSSGVGFYTKDLTMGSSDILDIDTATPELRLNGGPAWALADWSRSAWPLLEPGANYVTVGSSAYAAGALMSLSADPAYR